MSRLMQDGTAKPVARDQILRHKRGQENIHCLCSADHEQVCSADQSEGQLETRPHQRRSIVRIRHHLQELMSRSTAPVLVPPRTSHEYSDGHSTASNYGSPPPPASHAPAPPMPSLPRPHGLPPPAPPSESDWSFSFGHAQAPQTHDVPAGEFPNSVSSNWSINCDSVDYSYPPSAFVG